MPYKWEPGDKAVGLWISVDGKKHVWQRDRPDTAFGFQVGPNPPPATEDQPTCAACVTALGAKESD